MSDEQTVGFVGAGQMARALARGFVNAGLVPADRVLAADPSRQAMEQLLAAIPQARPAATSAALVAQADIVFLAVKPQSMTEVFDQLQEATKGETLFVSIAAGVTLARLYRGLGTDRVIRVMPNTPCLVGCGASGYALGRGASGEDGQRIGRLLESVGIAVPLEESLLDAVTGLSGSGPAFVYQVIEALTDGGIQVGLPRDVAQKLAAQTVRGASEMVIVTGQQPAVLTQHVASPGGTTIAGLAKLEQGALRATIMAAVEAATARSRQLGGEV
jgi:pyrroline-5-carboxylate reductase